MTREETVQWQHFKILFRSEHVSLCGHVRLSTKMSRLAAWWATGGSLYL